MKKKLGSMTFGVAGLLFFLALPIFAAMAPAAADEKLSIKDGVLKPVKIVLPDLQMKEISLSKNCELQATIANIGKGGVPDSAYNMLGGVVIKVFKGIKLMNSIGLKDFDPKKKLKNPGEMVTYVWPSSKVSTVYSQFNKEFRVVADAGNSLKEENESNNELTKELKCMAKPSLTIYDVDPPKADFVCWYRGANNTFGILWKTINYMYPNIQKITLTCLESWDQDPPVPCGEVTTLGANAPNSGKFFFHLPGTIHTGQYEIRVYGYGGIVSNVFIYCIW